MTRLLLIVCLLLSACAHLPTIAPGDAVQRCRTATFCQSRFLQGRWQLVHAINARLPGGRQAVFTGVIVMSSADASIHCVLMTLEGFVLFEALDDGQVTVRRALGPFDNDHFARGVMDDIRFVFLEPAGGIGTAGTFENGDDGCRYRTDSNRTVDLIAMAEGGWRLRQHDRTGDVRRTLTVDGVDGRGIASHLTLEAGGGRAYRLSMTLVEAIPLERSAPDPKYPRS